MFAQDTEPRRWSHLPVGLNVAGAVYVYTEGDILVDPVLLIDGAEIEQHTAVVSYTRSFGLAGKTARIEMQVPYQEGSWRGLLEGVPAQTRREGFGDPRLRLSINLIGAPALKGKEFGEYRAAHRTNTILGAALAIVMPLGEYQEDKVINLGANRFVFRPQIGVLHTRERWSYEVSGSVFLYTENDEFFNGNKVQKDPLYALQAHIIHSFRPGLWISLSAAYGWEGESEVNDVPAEDPQDKILSALSFGFPVGTAQGVKLAYIRERTQEEVGADTDSLGVVWSVRF